MLTPEQYHEKHEERTKKQCQLSSDTSQSLETTEVESNGSSDKVEDHNNSQNREPDSNHIDCDEPMKIGHISDHGINAKINSDEVKGEDIKITNISDNVKLAEGYQSEEVKDGDT